MADKWPLANGNYSTAANWNGGTLPVDGDVVYADGRTITIDQNINLPNARFRSTQRSGGTVGGSFTASTGTYSITILEAIGGSTAALVVQSTANVSFTNVLFRGSDTAANGWGLQISSGGNITFTNCVATGGNFGTNACGINASAAASSMSGTLSLTNGSSSQAPAILMTGAHNFELSGNVQHGILRTAVFSGTGTYTFTSETTTGATGSGNKLTVIASSTVTITRSDAATTLAFPNTWTATHFDLGANSVVNYTGDKKQSNSEIIATVAAGATFRHFGTIYGPDAAFGSIAFATAANAGAKVVLDKLQRNATSGLMPSLGNGWCLRSVSQINAATESGSVTLVPSGSVGDPPAIANVRSGTTYHFGTLTGTCAVPGASSVAAGVPVDATTGTAVLTSAAVQSGCNAALLAYDTNGVASVNDLAAIDVDLAPVLAKLPESGRGATQASVDAIAVGLSGSAPVEPTGTTVFEHLEAIQAATDSIGTRPIEFIGNVADGGQLLLTVGDDHETVIANDLPIRVKDTGQTLFNSLTAVGVTLQWSAGQGVTPNLITGTVTTPTHASGITTIIVQVPNTPSPAAPANIFAPFAWQLQRTISGRRQRMLKGSLKLDPDMIGS